jgi:predicted Zn-dependent protease
MSLNRMRPFLCSLLVVSCLALAVWAGPQTLGWRWKPNTRVTIYYLKSNFTWAERESFSRAVNNWNKALYEMGSRVVFRISGERESVAEDDASITVLRGIPKGKHRLGQLRFYSMSNGVMRATMIISPDVTDLNALTSLMAHEIGHSLGLADCYECQRGTTAMAAFKDKNKGNDVYEPSECDKYVVAAGYRNETDMQARIVQTERK